MGLLTDFSNRQSQPEEVAASAPMTQEQFVAQNPETSNPDYDFMLYQMQQEQIAKAQAEAQLQQTDPKAYANLKTQELADNLFNTFTTSGKVFGGRSNMEAENTAALEAFKQTDPDAYYNAVLSLDLRKAGWDAGQGKTNDITNARIQNNLQDAAKSGYLTLDEYQNLVANNYTNTAQWHAQNIADRKGLGATFQGIEKIAPAFAAMITAGALAPAAGALEAGAAGGIDAYMASAGLNPGVFEGAAFALPEFAASVPQYAGINDYMSQAGLDAGTFNKFTPTNPLTDYMGQAGLEPGAFKGAAFQMPVAKCSCSGTAATHRRATRSESWTRWTQRPSSSSR
jgi:hypothetical protein